MRREPSFKWEQVGTNMSLKKHQTHGKIRTVLVIRETEAEIATGCHSTRRTKSQVSTRSFNDRVKWGLTLPWHSGWGTVRCRRFKPWLSHFPGSSIFPLRPATCFIQREMKTHFHTETVPRMFITVLSGIIPNWNWAKRPSTVKWASVAEESRNGIWLKRNNAGYVQQLGERRYNYAAEREARSKRYVLSPSSY